MQLNRAYDTTSRPRKSRKDAPLRAFSSRPVSGEDGACALQSAAFHAILIEKNREDLIMHYTYRPRGVCSQKMDFELEDGKIRSVQVTGGCDGNLKGIASLVAGMDIDEAIKRMEGIRCGFKPTSCPDQMAKALRAFQSEHA